MRRATVIISIIATSIIAGLILVSCRDAAPEDPLTETALAAASFSSTLVAQHSDKCIEAGATRSDGRVPFVQKTCTGEAAQSFSFHPVEGKENVYTLKNAATQKCFDFSLSRTTDEGSPLAQEWVCHAQANQQFRLEPAGDSYTLVAQHNQRCIDVQRNSKKEDAGLHAWACNGGGNQTWQVDTTQNPGEPSPEPSPAEGASGLDARPSNTTCLAPEKVAAELGLSQRFANLSFAELLGLQQAPGVSSHWYALEKGGRVLRFPNKDNVRQSEVQTFINLSSNLSDEGEGGLLGLAFHPDFADNGYVYLHYTDTGFNSHISRFSVAADGTRLEPNSEKTLIELKQPFKNHNGGDITFGPDGYLYISLGDGGSQGDPNGNAQNKNTFFGSILRIDVDNGDPYGIPADNPFAGGGGAKEIFAYGLRNPWRMSFDRETGELWSADVGQNKYEEINIIESGKNYGWDKREGKHCFGRNSCSKAGFTDPVYEYSHDLGQSITGGYVYRGSQVEALQGSYVYGDFVSGTVWGLSPSGDGFENRKLFDSGANLSSFAQDNDGELYALDFSGKIFEFTATSTEATLPETLSETGCVDPENPTKMASGVIPYEVALPFWSDGAEKNRWFALPDDSSFSVDDEGDWELPPGGVSIKEFRLGDRLIETRFYVRHQDGSYLGYTYEWNDAQTEATLLTEGKERDFGEQTWVFPSSAACGSCHTEAAGNSLGLETRQLNRDATYPSTGRSANQLATLKAIGMLPSSAEAIAAHPSLDDDSASTVERAQAYLDVNCSSCHRPSGPGRGTMDLRSSTSLKDSNTCGAFPIAGDVGVSGSSIISPGDKDRSTLWLRLSRRDANAMPPLGSTVHDESGSEFLGQWIDSLNSCP